MQDDRSLWLVKHFILIHLKGVCTSEKTTCLISTMNIASGEFVGVPQVTMAAGVHVAVIRNVQVVSPTESQTPGGTTMDDMVWCVNSHLVVFTALVLQ